MLNSNNQSNNKLTLYAIFLLISDMIKNHRPNDFSDITTAIQSLQPQQPNPTQGHVPSLFNPTRNINPQYRMPAGAFPTITRQMLGKNPNPVNPSGLWRMHQLMTQLNK